MTMKLKQLTRIILVSALVSSCAEYQDCPDGLGVIPCPTDVRVAQGEYKVCKDWKKDIVLKNDSGMSSEAYSIDVTKNRIKVRAGDRNGFLYAEQTLEQLIDHSDSTIAVCHIYDEPRFRYRGMHLDCARHIFSVSDIKSYIDIMATYKMDRFHWHLTDEQGWRIECQTYPNLMEVGAWRDGTMIGKDLNSNNGIRYGGYYSKEDMKEIVNYAYDKGIEVIPEIDSPGHTLAALASYPEIGCTGGPYAVRTKWYHTSNALCPGKEATFRFLEGVLKETSEVFPYEYIHIGGDECGVEFWERCPDCQKRINQEGIKGDSTYTAEQKLLGYYVSREQEILKSLGKKSIAWEEVLVGTPVPGTIILAWTPENYKNAAKTAAKKGLDVVMTPDGYFYFNMYQTDNHDNAPLSYGGFTPLEKVYSFEPHDGLSKAEADHVIGVQACLWSEYCPSIEIAQYNILPRLLALSEVQWCKDKNYNRFLKSLNIKHKGIFERNGWNYCSEFTKNN